AAPRSGRGAPSLRTGDAAEFRIVLRHAHAKQWLWDSLVTGRAVGFRRVAMRSEPGSRKGLLERIEIVLVDVANQLQPMPGRHSRRRALRPVRESPCVVAICAVYAQTLRQVDHEGKRLLGRLDRRAEPFGKGRLSADADRLVILDVWREGIRRQTRGAVHARRMTHPACV